MRFGIWAGNSRHVTAVLSAAVVLSVAPPALARTCPDLFRGSNPAVSVSLSSFPDVLRALNRVQVFEPADVKSEEIDAVRGAHENAGRLSEILEKIGRAREVRTVLYPAAGFDAATPFRIFEHADVVIGMDNHPFARTKLALERSTAWERALAAPELPAKVNAVGWVRYNQINEQRSVLRGLTASLRSLGPGVRILSMEALDAYGHVEGRAIVHGIAKFDTGAGTRVRTYVHLHVPTDLTRETLPPWTAALMVNGYQAVLVKAAMGTYDRYAESFGGYLIDGLRKQGGFIVDGDGMLSRWPWWRSEAPSAEHGVSELRTDLSDLGYERVHIYEFQK